MLEELFVSRVRVKILQLFLSSPQESLFHVREIVRRVAEEINAVRRELSRMEKYGMVSSEWRANRRLYRFRKDYVYYNELVSLVAKTTGLGGSLIKSKQKLGKIKFAFISTRFLRGNLPSSDNVDILVVGNIVLPELQSLISDEQAKQDAEINYSFMDEAEFKFRVKRRDPFILRVLVQPKVMLIGDEGELLEGVIV
ncbi:winged helix-turn-helix transcriptional regulator [Candidatus Daviesbacteria bacterium]|nr:winged helix-turn-helix transcriptional regulator [Candidatus Daviesbacteria bacterium]